MSKPVIIDSQLYFYRRELSCCCLVCLCRRVGYCLSGGLAVGRRNGKVPLFLCSVTLLLSPALITLAGANSGERSSGSFPRPSSPPLPATTEVHYYDTMLQPYCRKHSVLLRAKKVSTIGPLWLRASRSALSSIIHYLPILLRVNNTYNNVTWPECSPRSHCYLVLGPVNLNPASPRKG